MVDKIRKTPEKIKNEILFQLKSGPKTIAEIGENIGSNWLTTEKFLNELKDDGKILEVVSSAKMKVFRRTDDIAFYGLPFSEKIRDSSASLLFTIADKWKKKTGTIPARTILQKVAVELIENSKGEIKEIPILRFHYGQTLAVRYDESFKGEYKLLNLAPEQLNLLSDLIKQYQGKPIKNAKLNQYKKKGMEFYLEKEENVIIGFSEEDYQKIEKSLLKLSIFYPIELKNAFPLFDKFVYCTTILLSLKEGEVKKEYFNKIKEIFYLLWDVITTEYFFYDSNKHILPEKKELFNQISTNILSPKIANLHSIIEDLESEVSSINPEELEIPMDEESIEIRKIFAEGAEEE